MRTNPRGYRLIKTAIAKGGIAKLQAMTDSDLRDFWNNEVLRAPDKFGLNRGAISGLSIVSPHVPKKWGEDEREPFIVKSGQTDRWQLSDTGILMLKAILQNYSGALTVKG